MNNIPSLSSNIYTVLYYKRTHNKVHKSKGVSKLDGILTVSPPPTCLVTLKDANQDEEESESSEEEDCKNKKKWKKNKVQKKKNGVVSSGINREVSNRAFGLLDDGCGGLVEDDVLVLSQWECQIVNLVNNAPSYGSRSAKTSQTRVATVKVFKRPGPSSLLANKQSVGGVKRGSTLIRKTMKKPFLSSTKSIPQAPTIKRPPAQPKESVSNSDDSDDEHNFNNNVSRAAIAPSLIRKHRAIVTRKSTISHTTQEISTITTPSSQKSLFPTAIGTITLPPSVNSKLRPHQRTGISFLWNCLTGSSPSLASLTHLRGAILADEMGLGKTLMTISVIFALGRKNRRQRFIVVCPSSLVMNWTKEFDKWLGKASQPNRIAISKGGAIGEEKINAFIPMKPQKTEVLILSYEMFRKHSDKLQNATNIGLLVVDEGHRLKNTGGTATLSALQRLVDCPKLLITGTPIQNNLSEFYNLVEFVLGGVLGDLPSFRRVYDRPITAANNKQATFEQKTVGQAQSAALDAITSTFMLRRLQKDILKNLLPPRTELLLFCRPSDLQCDLYQDLTNGYYNNSSGGGSGDDALTLLTKVRKLCSHPRLLDMKSTLTTSTPCESQVDLSGKLNILSTLLQSIRKSNPTDKCVIISNFTSALTLIEQTVLSTHNYTFLRLDGTIEQGTRQQLVDGFNRMSAEKSFAFLLSSKAGGCGLNLIGANRLIMFDPDWNPATDAQAMARVYRQGQNKPCFIYRLFTTGTVEEVIYQRQAQKGNLATMAVDGRTSSSTKKKKQSGFTKEELRDCFTLKRDCTCDTKEKIGNGWHDYVDLNTLLSLGCTDEPLLAVAEEQSDILTFVHVCNDNDDVLEEENNEDEDSKHSSMDQKGYPESSISNQKETTLGTIRGQYLDDDEYDDDGDELPETEFDEFEDESSSEEEYKF